MSAQTASEFSLTIERHFEAEPQSVFDAWTRPEGLVAWFAPSDDFQTVVHELDVRVGGRYRIAMHEDDGIHIVYGEYVRVDAPNSLVFTWSWEHVEDGAPMLVTLEFVAADGGTDMRLLHEKLPSAESRDLHAEGWAGCLARLERCTG